MSDTPKPTGCAFCDEGKKGLHKHTPGWDGYQPQLPSIDDIDFQTPEPDDDKTHKKFPWGLPI